MKLEFWVVLASMGCGALDQPTLEAPAPARGDVVPTTSLTTSADTTIFAHAPENASGVATEVLVGVGGAASAPLVFRGLVEFDLAALGLPPGAVVSRVTLALTVVGGPGTAVDSSFELVRLVAPWTEGTASLGTNAGQPCATNGGGATWVTSDCTTSWPAGGDLAATVTASTPTGVSLATVLTWDSLDHPALVADVQGWLAAPATNHGWALRTAVETTLQSVRRLASRTHATVTARPVLVVEYLLADGSACGDADECQSGLCVFDTCCAEACDSPDAAACEVLPALSCDGGTCAYDPIGDGTACADDGETCTADACLAGACAHTPLTQACDDGDPCSANDACSAGACDGGPNPCGADLPADVAALATCQAGAAATYDCYCPAGFADDGATCTDLDECVLAVASCPFGTVCENRPGAFECIALASRTDGGGCGAVSGTSYGALSIVLLMRRRRRAATTASTSVQDDSGVT
jgi:hypothetical protein